MQASGTSSAGPMVHVEVRLKPHGNVEAERVQAAVILHLTETHKSLQCESELQGWSSSPVLKQYVDKIRIGESSCGQRITHAIDACSLQVLIYQPEAVDFVDEFSAGDPAAEDGDDTPAASVTELPNRSLDGVWDSLIYEEDIKPKLLNYIYATMLFSAANVNFDLVSWNRVVLLHGPPGTGKTSLCKALAQKICIRLINTYSHGKLVEINSHSLFSKWFSESGKLVQRLFSMIGEMADDDECFVVVLIDEVESLTAARSAAASGTEPSDAIRVVNALLTQLDKLKHRKNVLIMTTSNITESIDTAFIDRADIKQYIGPPPPKAIYWILESCIKELMRVGLVQTTPILPFDATDSQEKHEDSASHKLRELAYQCQGLSGRTLRRLPVLAHARHINLGQNPISCSAWTDGMHKALLETQKDLRSTLVGSGASHTHVTSN